MFKLSKILLAGALAAILIIGAVAFTTARASADTSSQDAVCSGVGIALGPDGSCDTGSGDGGLGKLVSNVISILSIIVGVVAVIMIIVGAFKYITSGGESSNTAGAKNTIVYALVGLVIAALAQVLIHFVLTQAGKATSSTPSTNCPDGSVVRPPATC